MVSLVLGDGVDDELQVSVPQSAADALQGESPWQPVPRRHGNQQGLEEEEGRGGGAWRGPHTWGEREEQVRRSREKS